MEYPPIGITRKYIAAFVKVFVLAAFLVAAVQTSVSAASYEYAINVCNKTGETMEYLSVACNNTGNYLDFENVADNTYVVIYSTVPVENVAVVATLRSGATRRYDNLTLDGAWVYIY